MGSAEVISLSDVRASKQWDRLREQLPCRFDQWLDELQEPWPEPTSTLAEVTETVGNLRHNLPGGLSETMIPQAHLGEQSRKHAPCAQCDRLVTARPAVSRTVEPMGGAVQLERPSFYGTVCRCGRSPFDETVGWTPGRLQLDGHQAAARLVIDMPYDEAQTLLGDLPGVGMGRERMPTLTPQAAEGLTVWDVAPSRAEMERRIAEMAAGRCRRPVVGLGMDGA